MNDIRVVDPGEIVPTVSRGSHIQLTCKNHPWLFWSQKNIYGRSVFFQGFYEIEFWDDSIFVECTCSAALLVPTGKPSGDLETKMKGKEILAEIEKNPATKKWFKETMEVAKEVFIKHQEEQVREEWINKPANSKRMVMMRWVQGQSSDEGYLKKLKEMYECHYMHEELKKLEQPSSLQEYKRFMFEMNDISPSEVRELARLLKQEGVRLKVNHERTFFNAEENGYGKNHWNWSRTYSMVYAR